MYISPHRSPPLLVAAGRGDSLKGRRIYVRRRRAEKNFHKREVSCVRLVEEYLLGEMGGWDEGIGINVVCIYVYEWRVLCSDMVMFN